MFVLEVIASLIPSFNKLVWVSEFLSILSARYVSVRVHLFSLDPVSRMVIKFSESQVFVAGVCGSNLGLCSCTYGSRRMSIYECLLGEQLLNKTYLKVHSPYGGRLWLA